MSPRLTVGIIALYVACWGFAMMFDGLFPGTETVAFIILAALMTVLIVLAWRQGKLKI